MKQLAYISFSIVVLCTCLIGCKKEEATDPNYTTDKAFYLMLIKSGEFSYYKNEDKIIQPSSSSPHKEFKLSFNKKALSALGTDGKLPKVSSFPDSSIVLKTIYNGNEIDSYVPMMKMSNDPNSEGGWLWAKYAPDGEIQYSIAKKGDDCAACHSDNARDYVLSFDIH